ncbi:putative protein TPRXL [Lates calcarifer]|uniref:Uncharacterized protein n=1 Tax=Lates calcarifer TaxID=8187 RepID=A0AAJ7LQN2_LATCA|nr:putative protein TPRXL [Lates calcarifer]
MKPIKKQGRRSPPSTRAKGGKRRGVGDVPEGGEKRDSDENRDRSRSPQNQTPSSSFSSNSHSESSQADPIRARDTSEGEGLHREALSETLMMDSGKLLTPSDDRSGRSAVSGGSHSDSGGSSCSNSSTPSANNSPNPPPAGKRRPSRPASPRRSTPLNTACLLLLVTIATLPPARPLLLL